MMVSAIFSGVSSAGTMTGCSTGGTCNDRSSGQRREGEVSEALLYDAVSPVAVVGC